jgi:hypothetical protein
MSLSSRDMVVKLDAPKSAIGLVPKSPPERGPVAVSGIA